MNLLQTALEAIELLTTDNSSEQAQAAAADARIKLMNAMAHVPEADFGNIVEPEAWTWDTAGTGWTMTGCVEAHFAFNKPHPDKCILNLRPLYLHPPQPQATTPVPEGYALVPIEPTEAMVDAYLAANTAYWLRTDELPKTDPSRWRQGTPSDATAESYRAMINAAQGEKP